MQRSFDLCVALYAHVNRFPRAHKSLLGRDLLAAVQRMLIGLITATRHRERLPILQEADLQLEALRILVRLSHRLTFLPHKGYEVLSRELTEIGRMLGGWIKASRGALSAMMPEDPSVPLDGMDQKRPKGRSAVRYTMKSPKVEEHLKAKLAHPHEIVLVKTGAFYKTFFEDAMYLNRTLHLKIQNLSAESEPERIVSCGFPVTALEKFRARLAPLGRAFYVPESEDQALPVRARGVGASEDSPKADRTGPHI